MTDLASIAPPNAAAKRRRWMAFLFITAAIHVAVMLECPSIHVPPRISEQLPKLMLVETMLVIPSIWSVFITLRYRGLEERVIGILSLAASAFWLLIGAEFLRIM